MRWRDLHLHDGRTQGLQTAMRVHGGEAAQPRQRPDQLPQVEHTQFIEWFKTL
ncbi:MAG: hypothetical protein FJ100_11455 [Deltaproteobacteria bacterium]|nr:hypothetical protein [Deltaproteobacteria bacterium]